MKADRIRQHQHEDEDRLERKRRDTKQEFKDDIRFAFDVTERNEKLRKKKQASAVKQSGLNSSSTSQIGVGETISKKETQTQKKTQNEPKTYVADFESKN